MLNLTLVLRIILHALFVANDDASIGAICCDRCNGWTHATCARVTIEEFHVLTQSDKNWFCASCLMSELPYSISHNLGSDAVFEPKLKCRSLNARSIVNKTLDLNALLYAEKLDILAITETFLSPDIFDHEIVHNSLYSVFRRDRNRHGGGVMLLVKNTLSATRRQDLETDCEILWVELRIRNRNFLVSGLLSAAQFSIIVFTPIREFLSFRTGFCLCYIVW